ncbi:MAG: bifunctional hydroxymethylpyrimidine kinase/phosphomethylpyrimidine kinase [Acidobacteria bacterium]|nr:bifunctional hydroxymethylpyrimidine kinase/phosphomethylpyrimidine kinase [Acidobacteriota bacterium]MBI3427369.1 bifunctional hydroxymethylpyrimidine kinase/phosphomethylpyrimidine kinase [Acidobacteriota bacterium]
MRVVLTIAGFDPSAGAGTLADIKTLAAFGCFGVAAVTSLTAQNTQAVYGAYHQPATVVRAQLAPLLEDFDIAAVKLGMLPNRAIIETVAEIITAHKLPNIVLDPVIRSTSGYDLIDDAALTALVKYLLPLADIITPNLPEAERLTGLPVKDVAGMRQAAKYLRDKSAIRNPQSAILIKGGHLPDEATDLFDDGQTTHLLYAPKISTRNTHGTGCTLSSAIAAGLALGAEMPQAVQRAKEYVSAALRSAPDLGHGAGPLNHWFSFEQG